MPSDDGDGFQHLHPASLLFILGEVVRPFVLPLLVVMVLGGGRGFETWFVVLAVPATAAALARYATYRYRLAEDELIIRHGIVQRNERHVPFERIQNIDMSRSVLHRALGVASVTIQTASGSDPEAVMRVLSLEGVEAMRSHVFGRRQQAAGRLAELGEEKSDLEMRPRSRTLVQTPVDDLVRYGVISNKGMIVLAAAIGLLWQLNIDPIEWVTDRIPGLETVELPHLVAIGVLLFVLAVIGLRLLSVLWAVVSFYGFTLRRADEELGAEFGLLTQRTVTIPIHRIQLVTVEENLLHRALQRVSVRARTAGSASGENAAERHDWLAPVLPRRHLEALLADVDAELSPADVEWRPLPRRAVWRAVRRAGLPVLVVGVPPAFFHPWLWVVTPAVAGLFAVLGALAVRHTFWGRTEHGVWLRRGWLTRTTRAVRYATIQTVALAENPFDRRARMADVEVDTANSGAGTPAIRIPYLEVEDARQLAADLAEQAARTPFRW